MNIMELVAQYNELRKKMVDNLEESLKTAFNEILANQEEITSVSWTQYTPYFNDGDTCTFWVNSDSLYLNGEDYEEMEETPVVEKTSTEISNLLYEIPDDLLQSVFGDHVKVTFTKDKGFTTEEYYHD